MEAEQAGFKTWAPSEKLLAAETPTWPPLLVTITMPCCTLAVIAVEVELLAVASSSIGEALEDKGAGAEDGGATTEILLPSAGGNCAPVEGEPGVDGAAHAPAQSPGVALPDSSVAGRALAAAAAAPVAACPSLAACPL